MTLNQFMFILFSGIIVTFSILTVTSRKILRAAVYLLFVLVSTAGLYFILKFIKAGTTSMLLMILASFLILIAGEIRNALK